MARLIDADAIIDFIDMDSTWDPLEICFSEKAVVDMLESAPTVDAVEVVRCRDCKHFRNYGKTSLFINGKNIKAGWCQRRIRYDEEYRMTADDFCSYGERKDGDGNG